MRQPYSSFYTLHSLLLVTLRLLRKYLVEIRAFGLHPFIPKGEIKSIVKSELRMMQAVMGSANQPATQPVLIEVAGINFGIQVIDGAGNRHDQQ